jgi:hypothetical protein
MLSVTQTKDELTRKPDLAIEGEMQRILKSEAFKGSKRSKQFLSYVVEKAASGQAEELKERTLGIELFQREPTFDTGEDAIVRVTAADVRRRLTQYNLVSTPDQVVRIDLLPGSYVPHFQWNSPQPPRPLQRRVGIWILMACLVSVALAAATWPRHDPNQVLRSFWKPVLENSNPVMICMGHPVVYLLSSRVHQSFREKHGAASDQEPYQIKPEEIDITAKDIVPVPDQYLGVGDAQAAFRIGVLLRALGKPSQLRTGYDVSFADLKSLPIVLVGAYSNKWTMQMTSDLPFAFKRMDGRKVVVDRGSPERSWSPASISPSGQVSEDYGIVSRILMSKSGQALIMAAGITQYGSQAAGEFLTDAALLTKAIQQAPKGWEQMNMQVVVRAKIIGSAPSQPEIVAVRFW